MTTSLVQSAGARVVVVVWLTSQCQCARRELFHHVLVHESRAIQRVSLLQARLRRDSSTLPVMRMVMVMLLALRLLLLELLLLLPPVVLVRF